MGSLYDALYGTDAVSERMEPRELPVTTQARGAKVIAAARDFLDQAVPLATGSHKDSAGYTIVDGQLVVAMINGDTTTLADTQKLIGYTGETSAPLSILFENNGLHFEVQIDRDSQIGKEDAAGIKDIIMEAALTAIMDCEDSVAAVDGDDKVVIYRNWLGLMKGDLTEEVSKGGKTFTRRINADREFTALDGSEITLKGRSLMFVRNVGHLMTNEAILDNDGNEIPEGIMDGVITTLISIHDMKGTGKFSNTTTGSTYIVKPKMHGPEEVAFANELFARIEDMLGLARFTMKNGHHG